MVSKKNQFQTRIEIGCLEGAVLLEDKDGVGEAELLQTSKIIYICLQNKEDYETFNKNL